MLKSYGWSSRVCWYEQSGMLVAHVILVSAQVLLVLTLGLWDFGLGLDNNPGLSLLCLWCIQHFWKWNANTLQRPKTKICFEVRHWKYP